jgi:peptidoglycan/xylan/chitin deacetylase (PgdA/CDA1 family)
MMITNPVPWPDGARCAVVFTWDMDADSILHLAHPRDADTRLSTNSMLRYGPEIGVPRIIELCKRLGIKQTFFVPGWCAEQYPRAVELMVAHGHEVALHGYLHEYPNELSQEEERFWTHKGAEALARIAGQRPRGYRAPWYKISSCKFFGDGTGQSLKTHARVDFPRIRQANTQEVSRWHASASPWKTTMAARSMATRSASMTCLEGQSD